jgi:DamX protein
MIITATVQPSPVVTPTPAPITKAINPTEADIAAEKKPTTENSSLADKPSSTPTTDQEWIMAQPANNFTLQVMTLSSNDSVRRFKKKYAEYGESLKYYTVYKGEQEKFILIYGSFESIAEAKRYKEIMPGEFKQALEKRFRFVQKESHR